MNKKIRVYAPATIANVGPGFDLLGLAIDSPGDVIELEAIEAQEHRIINESKWDLPADPAANVAAVALDAFLEKTGIEKKFSIRFLEKIPPGSGIGSSAASSAGAVFAANELTGNPLETKDLVMLAMKGEALASGSEHADNVAPALLGGMTLVHSYQPLGIIEIDVPPGLFCTVVHPDISIATSDSRRILKAQVPMQTAIRQSGKLAGLITGMLRSDYTLIASSLDDYIAEPERAFLIPAYYNVKDAALKAGALGAGISGSGPAIFALSKDRKTAEKAGEGMQSVFRELRIECDLYVSSVSRSGVRTVG